MTDQADPSSLLTLGRPFFSKYPTKCDLDETSGMRWAIAEAWGACPTPALLPIASFDEKVPLACQLKQIALSVTAFATKGYQVLSGLPKVVVTIYLGFSCFFL